MEIIQKDFLSKQANFLLPTDLERNFQPSKIMRKKWKTFMKLNWSQKEKWLIEKGIQAFWFSVFGILNWYQSFQHQILLQEL